MGSKLGERLRARARELKLSDAEVARRVGLSQSRYANYVSGAREPDYETFGRICRALGFTPNEALGFQEASGTSAEVERLRRRMEAAMVVMDLRTLRTAAAVLDVLVSQAVEGGNQDLYGGATIPEDVSG